MARYILGLLLIVGLCGNSYAQKTSSEGEKINWMTWKEMVEQRKKDTEDGGRPKKVFIDMYTSWCGWCKKMDATTFKDPVVVQYMNTKYYPVKMDAEMKEEIKFNGHTFVNPNPGGKRSTHQMAASLLNNKLSYPSYVLLDENMNRVCIFPGYKKTESLMGILMFYGTNQHTVHNQYMQQQAKIKQMQQQQQNTPK